MPSEFDLIARHFTRPTPMTVLGPGDDCALIQPTPGKQLAVTTDMLVSGTHFLPQTDPERLGWKALAVNLSDLAAMGAQPRWATLAGSLPEANEDWIASFSRGFFDCASVFSVDIIGGDTTRGPLNLCVTAIGEVEPGRALCRHGAQAGDDIWVSGQPGLAALGLAHVQARTQLPEPWPHLCQRALEQPQPRVALGLGLVGIASAAIDISDGLLADLGHIAERSHLQAMIYLTRFPHQPKGVDRILALDCLLAGGDDYELCFTAPVRQRSTIAALAARLELPLWRIGEMTAAAEGEAGKVSVLDAGGQPLSFLHRGFDHFG
ncbi:MAG: Thiamine-monophosphate kinase [Betaproteobacteria bacterium ADurb.Bin341]|nr:MAG: Thiamine-monophosphate kinase [Betaproteobacteria bacterium ADurb.Bin341]